MTPQPSETRDRLLQATIAIIEEHGEAAVSVDAVGKAAGVTAPTIYNYFRNRDALVAAAQAVRFDDRLAEDFTAFASVVDGIHTREQFVEITTWLLQAFSNPERAALRMNRIGALGAVGGRAELQQEVVARFTALCSQLADVIRPLQDRGIVRADLDLLAFSAWFTGAITGRLFIELGETAIDAAAWDRVMLDSTLHLLLGPEPA